MSSKYTTVEARFRHAAAWPNHGQESPRRAGLAPPGQQPLDEGLAAEEVRRIGLLEGPQALIGVGAIRQVKHDRRPLNRALRIHLRKCLLYRCGHLPGVSVARLRVMCRGPLDDGVECGGQAGTAVVQGG